MGEEPQINSISAVEESLKMIEDKIKPLQEPTMRLIAVAHDTLIDQVTSFDPVTQENIDKTCATCETCRDQFNTNWNIVCKRYGIEKKQLWWHESQKPEKYKDFSLPYGLQICFGFKKITRHSKWDFSTFFLLLKKKDSKHGQMSV